MEKHNYLCELSSDQPRVNIYKQLVGWLIRLPGTRLVDHFATFCQDPLTGEPEVTGDNSSNPTMTTLEEQED